MKIVRFFVFGILCLLPMASFAQWSATTLTGSINSVAIGKDGSIFAGTDNGVMKSNDGGGGWVAIPDQKFGGSNYQLKSVWGVASNGDVYANVGFWEARSTNNGTDWTVVKITPDVGSDPNLQSMIFDQRGDIVAVTGTTGFMVSTDRGGTWNEFNISQDGYDYPTAFAMSPKGTRFGSTIKGSFDTMPALAFSTNTGYAWKSVATPPAGGLGSSASIHFNSSGMGIASGSNGVFYSSDNGNTWTQIDQNASQAQLATVIAENGYIFQAQSSGGTGIKVLRTPGGSWEDASGPMAGKQVFALTIGRNNHVFAGSEAGLFFIGDNLDVKPLNDGAKPFALEQNMPNPASKMTTIHFSLAEAAPVTLKLYDFAGREMACLACANYGAGSYDVSYDVRNLAAGVYYYELHAGTSSAGRLMIVRP